MVGRTKNFNELRDRGRRADPHWDAKVAEIERAMRDALALADLRESLNVTQVQLAENLGISQGNVSRVEARTDVYVSTLRAYVEALGGHLEIVAVFGNHRISLSVGPHQRDDAAPDRDEPTTLSGRGRPAARSRSSSASGSVKPGRTSGTGRRAQQAVAKISEQPGITASELAKATGITRNYLYRILPQLEQEAKVAKRGRGYHLPS
jgi:transcriptional regulator with XRE-family HTH domain